MSEVATPPASPAQVPDAMESAPDIYALALSHHRAGRYAEAIEILELACANPLCGLREVSLLVRSLADQGELARALLRNDEWIGLDKLNASPHYLRAVILQEQGHLELANASLRNAIYLDPDFPLAYFCMGNIARLRGKFSEADRHLETALRLLRRYQPDDIVPESDGVTAGRLIEMIRAMTKVGAV